MQSGGGWESNLTPDTAYICRLRTLTTLCKLVRIAIHIYTFHKGIRPKDYQGIARVRRIIKESVRRVIKVIREQVSLLDYKGQKGSE